MFSFLTHYCGSLLEKATILIPFAYLLAVMHTLQNLKKKRELIVLQSAGFALKRILRPFFIVTLAVFLFFVLHSFHLLPYAFRYQRQTKEARTLYKLKQKKIPQVHYITLENNSFLFYEEFIAEKEELKRVIWVKNKDTIYQIDKLLFDTLPAKAIGVKLLKSDNQGGFALDSIVKEKNFRQLGINKAMIYETLKVDEERSTKELLSQLKKYKLKSEKHAKTLSALFYRLVTPFFTVIALFLPLILVFNQEKNASLITYLVAIFCLALGYLLLDTGSLLAKRQALHPFYAIITPQFLLLFFILLKTRKLQWS